MAQDPANLLRAEIFDEFRGHVWLPLLPIAILLIGGTLLIIRSALHPVAEAAAWARSIQPGRGLPALDQPRAPAEIVDLTDTKRRSLEWLDAELAAEQRRAAEAAHALRTPVAVLVARLDELPQTAEFDSLRSDVFALSRMVTQFLSSSAADRLEILDDVRADLRAVAESVVAELFPMAAAPGIDIVLSTAHGSQQVHGSADAIALALTNLIENAIHHVGSGLIEVSVGPGPVLSVRDHGSGFPEMGRDDLTEPFLRGIGAPRGGAGLGLAIVCRNQRAHGGGVDLCGAPGGGALVRLTYRAA